MVREDIWQTYCQLEIEDKYHKTKTIKEIYFSIWKIAMNDEMGDRLKEIEMAEAGRKSLKSLPVISRLDGNNFSKFTLDLARPYDKRLSDLMIATTVYLVKETSATCGYTQSDEITLSWYAEDYKCQIWFDGRFQKITSVLAAKCSVFFNKHLAEFIPEKAGCSPVFDCRTFQVPTLAEGANFFLWRELDATKNAISMAARHYFDHAELHKKIGSEMQEMLFSKHGINFNDYPNFFRRGSYVRRENITRKLTPKELDELPEKHEARKNPDLVYTRSEYRRVEVPRLTSVKNRIGFIFFGEEPKTEKVLDLDLLDLNAII